MASTGSLNMPPTANPIPETCPAINKTAAVPTTAKAKKSRSKHKAAAAAAVAVKKDVQSVAPSKADSDDGTVNDVDLQKRLQINSSVPETTATTSPTEDADAPPQTNGHDVNAEKASAVDPASSAPSTKEPTEAGAAAAVAPAADSAAAPVAAAASAVDPSAISYVIYQNELQMPDIMRLIQKDLSEPYSIYTYRYFIHNWPKLCFLAMHNEVCVGAIVCKLDIHRQTIKRGYIAMLAVDKDYRKLQIGTKLVQNAIQAMLSYDADEVVLETEITNTPALRLYENLGFVRDKRLFGYYLNGVDALRLKLWFR